MTDKICHQCGRPCRAVEGPTAEWDCCCTDACDTHHRNCGQGGYICQWCRAGNPDPRRRTLREMIAAYETETGKALNLWQP